MIHRGFNITLYLTATSPCGQSDTSGWRKLRCTLSSAEYIYLELLRSEQVPADTGERKWEEIEGSRDSSVVILKSSGLLITSKLQLLITFEDCFETYDFITVLQN